MSRVIAIAFAVVVSAGVFAPAYATMSAPQLSQSVIEPVRMCFDKFCDGRGKCTYRPKQCPRTGPLQ
jgi:hypothetical protein